MPEYYYCHLAGATCGYCTKLHSAIRCGRCFGRLFAKAAALHVENDFSRAGFHFARGQGLRLPIAQGKLNGVTVQLCNSVDTSLSWFVLHGWQREAILTIQKIKMVNRLIYGSLYSSARVKYFCTAAWPVGVCNVGRLGASSGRPSRAQSHKC